jgi:hypothetical protein
MLGRGYVLNLLRALSPTRSVLDLDGFLSAQIGTEHLLHGLAHLGLEPQRHLASMLLRTLQDQLVVH